MFRAKGVTLTELLIAIAIITIMSTVTYAGLTSLLPYWRLSGSTKELMTNIAEAQEYSVSQQVIHKIVFNLGNDSYQIVKENAGGDQVVETVSLSRINIDSLSANITDNTIKFNFVGAPLNNANQPLSTSQIILSNGSRTSTIEISPAGNIKSY